MHAEIMMIETLIIAAKILGRFLWAKNFAEVFKDNSILFYRNYYYHPLIDDKNGEQR